MLSDCAGECELREGGGVLAGIGGEGVAERVVPADGRFYDFGFFEVLLECSDGERFWSERFL